jgi:FPC/CPF motif-containing protein YcgG
MLQVKHGLSFPCPDEAPKEEEVSLLLENFGWAYCLKDIPIMLLCLPTIIAIWISVGSQVDA